MTPEPARGSPQIRLVKSTLLRRLLAAALLAAAGAALVSCRSAGPRRPGWVGSSGADAGGIDGVGVSGYRPADAEGVKKARDAAYNDAMQKLSLKLRAAVRGEVRTSLQSRIKGGAEVAEETVESVTGSVCNAVLGRKRFEEYRDERRREYWVRCAMSREDADAAVRETLAAEARRRSLRVVAVQLSGSDAALAAWAETEFKRRFSEQGFVVLAQDRSAEARIAVAGDIKTEDLGPARALGVDLGRSCRAALRAEALVAQGSAGRKVVSGRTPQDATGIGRTPAEACEKAVHKAAAAAAAYLVEQVSRTIEE